MSHPNSNVSDWLHVLPVFPNPAVSPTSGAAADVRWQEIRDLLHQQQQQMLADAGASQEAGRVLSSGEESNFGEQESSPSDDNIEEEEGHATSSKQQQNAENAKPSKHGMVKFHENTGKYGAHCFACNKTIKEEVWVEQSRPYKTARSFHVKCGFFLQKAVNSTQKCRACGMIVQKDMMVVAVGSQPCAGTKTEAQSLLHGECFQVHVARHKDCPDSLGKEGDKLMLRINQAFPSPNLKAAGNSITGREGGGGGAGGNAKPQAKTGNGKTKGGRTPSKNMEEEIMQHSASAYDGRGGIEAGGRSIGGRGGRRAGRQARASQAGSPEGQGGAFSGLAAETIRALWPADKAVVGMQACKMLRRELVSRRGVQVLVLKREEQGKIPKRVAKLLRRFTDGIDLRQTPFSACANGHCHWPCSEVKALGSGCLAMVQHALEMGKGNNTHWAGLVSLELSHHKLDAAGLVGVLFASAGLERLSLHGSQWIQVAGPGHGQAVDSKAVLTGVWDSVVQAIFKCTGLRLLDLSNFGSSDYGFDEIRVVGMIARALPAATALTSLNLSALPSRLWGTRADTQQLLAALPKANNIQELRLGSNRLLGTMERTAALTACLPRLTQLTRLDLSHCGLGSGGEEWGAPPAVQDVRLRCVSALRYCTGLAELDLSTAMGNPSDPDEQQALQLAVTALSGCGQLRRLKLGRWTTGDRVTPQLLLAALPCWPGLTHLDLSGAETDYRNGMLPRLLLRALAAHCPRLSVLVLDDFASQYAERSEDSSLSLARNCRGKGALRLAALTHLSARGNECDFDDEPQPQPQPQSVVAATAVPYLSRRCEYLDVSCCVVSPGMAAVLARRLVSGSIVTLRLARCGLTDATLKPLAKAIPALPALAWLDLAANRFGRRGLERLASGVTSVSAPRLRLLDLSKLSGPSDSGLGIAAQALLRCTTLAALCLAGSPVGVECLDALGALLSKGPAMELLDIHDTAAATSKAATLALKARDGQVVVFEETGKKARASLWEEYTCKFRRARWPGVQVQ